MVSFNPVGTGRLGSTQDWIVPASGPYVIEARGARGGYAYLLSSTTVNPGGTAARLSGKFDLVAGQTIRMMVGHTGGDNPIATRGAPGGGGTFVFNQTTGTLLIAAGGGGGAGQYANGTLKNASLTTKGNAGMSGGNINSQGNGGQGPLGGIVVGSYAGAGGGYTGNGANASYGQGGLSYTNGGTGGLGYNDNVPSTIANFNGGYGGGGGSYAGAGGGGGYGGGGNGGWSYSGDGGGGGSFNGGTEQQNVVDHYAAGFVSIELAATAPLAPTGLAPASQIVLFGEDAPVGWDHNQDQNRPQFKYQLRWRRADY